MRPLVRHVIHLARHRLRSGGDVSQLLGLSGSSVDTAASFSRLAFPPGWSSRWRWMRSQISPRWTGISGGRSNRQTDLLPANVNNIDRHPISWQDDLLTDLSR